MKKRAKLLALSAAVVAAAATVSAPAFGDNPTNFVLISSRHYADVSVTVTEWDSAGGVLRQKNQTFSSDAWYWIIDSNADHITVDGRGRDWRIPASGPLSAANYLPACMRITVESDLHPADGICNTSGASQATWATP